KDRAGLSVSAVSSGVVGERVDVLREAEEPLPRTRAPFPEPKPSHLGVGREDRALRGRRRLLRGNRPETGRHSEHRDQRTKAHHRSYLHDSLRRSTRPPGGSPASAGAHCRMTINPNWWSIISPASPTTEAGDLLRWSTHFVGGSA